MSPQFRCSRSGWSVLFLDFAILALCYLAGYATFIHLDLSNRSDWQLLGRIPWLVLIGVMTFYMFNLYHFAGRMDYSKYGFNLLFAHVVIAAELIVLDYFFPSFMLSRGIVVMTLALQLVTLCVVRLLFFYRHSFNRKKKALIVAGDMQENGQLVEKLLLKGKRWFEVKYIMYAGDPSLKFAISSPDIEAVIISPCVDARVKADLLNYAGSKGKEALVVPEYYELFLMGAESQQIDDLLVYSVSPTRIGFVSRWMKRALDLVLALLLLAAASPIMLTLFVLIPLTSRGKALYSQERIGLGEQPFMVYKFRSMIDNAEKTSGPVLASDKDERITKIGKFIRETRMDELPQLFNVIKGNMSLVGPRPEREFFINQFKREFPQYSSRFLVKPGITGLAQVMGNYSTLASDKLRYDLAYIRNYSPLLDLKILLQTITVVFHKEQSKGLSDNNNSMPDHVLNRVIPNQAEIAISQD